MDTIKAACQEYLDWLESDDYHEDGSDDYRHAIFVAAMEAVFGPDIWKRHNAAQMRERAE